MSKSFRGRVAEFWRAFSNEESEIRSMMDNKVKGETLIRFVDNILSIAFTKSYFEMGINDEGKYELILTPEGDRAKLFQLHYWLKQAPVELLNKWNFYSSKPGDYKPGNQLDMYDIKIVEEDVLMYSEIDNERKKINIQIYSPKLMLLDENKRYSMFFIYLDRIIGELYTMEYIGYIDFMEEKPNLPLIDVSNFKEFINKTVEIEEWAKLDSPTDLYSGYRLEPNEDEGWKLREDVYIGMTSCVPVINSFLNHNDELFDEFSDDGVVFGFLFYENINVPNEEMVPFRSEIEDKILDIVEPQGIADSIGGATGYHFSYIDFIIYDFDAFIKVAREVMSQYTMEEIGYSDFVYEAEPIVFA
jgi:hypothetical protein